MKFFKSACVKESAAMRQPRSKRIRLILVTCITSWLLAIGAGLSVLWGYENTPGGAAKPPRQWPVDSRIRLERDRATLVMIAHPQCPCTRASIGELASLMAHSQGRLNAYVLFIKPTGFSDDWEKTDLWRSARSIPGVEAFIDNGGAEARRFNALTSGQALLYGVDGRLLFSGGMTGSRGHSGDNAGRSAIASLVNTGAAERDETFVFGCPLFDNSECRESRDEKTKH